MKSLKEMQETALDATKPGTVNPKELLQVELLSSFEKYTKCMFKAQYHRSFIVAEHHKKMFEVLQDVVDGKCKRLIINIAPRYGKCHCLTDEVFTYEGLKQVKDITPGDKVYSFHEGKVALNKVLATEPAYKDTYTIRMRSGRSITASYDHPILTAFGYTELKDLKIGDRIQTLCAELDSNYEIDDNELLLAALLIFEGKCGDRSIAFANTDPKVVEVAKKAVKHFGCQIKQYKGAKPFEYWITGGYSGGVCQMLKRNNLLGHTAYNKRIPRNWFGLSMRQKYMFIDMMIATDGAIDKRSGQICIGLANKGLIQDIQHMLSTMGIVSTYNFYDNEHAGVWVLAIPRKYAQKLYPHLTFYGKAEAAKSIIEKQAQCHLDTYPYEIIRHEKMTYNTAYAPYRCSPRKNITRDKFSRLASTFPKLSKYLCDDFYLDEVVDIEFSGMQELRHLEVENDHNFIANGLVSHNTELVIKSFISWCFALNPRCRFLHLSYSDILVNDNSETIRNIMQEELYKTLFPNSALASEKGSAKRWKTKAGGELYAVSTQGQVTGFGAGAVDEVPDIDKMDGGNDIFTFDDHTNEMLDMIGATTNIFQGAIVIDDPIKPEDAESDIVRERINMRFENTIRNRTNSRNTPIIIIMQRLHEHDLCGYLQEIEPDEWTVLSLPVIQVDPETGEEHALWPMKHTLEELYKMREINPLVFDTQYMQDPTPKEGLMYEGFRTYKIEELPTGTKALQKWNYTDTADTGADDLCSICFINTPEYCYITDILFTDAPMEVTEPKQAEMLTKNGTVEALIESNNGGRGYSRNVKRILRVDLRNFRCAIKTFTQTENKKARIYTASANVQSDILFPEGWERKWPKFYKALMSYRKDNKKRNQHDDAPDCLTGVYEMHARKGGRKKIHLRN
jgi:predicted phage terminase large subunit-like protein|nr:MAG TPA: Large Terminase [Caudoviricetes sp.]